MAGAPPPPPAGGGAPARPGGGRDTLVEGTRLTLQLEDGDELTWTNHDPQRMRRILELVHGQGAAYPRFHALRIGPYWFNCATETDLWQECRLSQAAGEA